VPTPLTLGQICRAPLVVVLPISTDSIKTLVAAMLFAATAMIDCLDGLIACRRGQVTTLGRLLDRHVVRTSCVPEGETDESPTQEREFERTVQQESDSTHGPSQ